MTIRSTASIALILTMASTAAIAHDGDIGLSWVNGRVITGIVSVPGPGPTEFVIPGQRIFAGEFTDIAGTIYSPDPGFFSGPLLGQTASALPANSTLRFNILGSLLRWDAAAQNFSSTTPSERLRIEFAAGALTRTSPLDGSTVAGFGFNTGPTGGFDEHFDFYLDPAANQPAPADGIYAIALDLFIDGQANSNSLPYYTVFNFNADEAQHDAAIDFIASNIIPAPSTAAALLITTALIATRRRRP